MKLNINGYARHGKDTVADLFVKHYGLRKVSASHIYARDIIAEGYLGPYESVEECYQDRVNHRAAWYEFVRSKAREDPTYYVRQILAEGDMYVGHRGIFEYESTCHLFDATIWVDASKRGLPGEGKDSCEMSPTIHHDFYIDNGGDLWETKAQVDAVYKLILNKKEAINAESS